MLGRSPQTLYLKLASDSYIVYNAQINQYTSWQKLYEKQYDVIVIYDENMLYKIIWIFNINKLSWLASWSSGDWRWDEL